MRKEAKGSVLVLAAIPIPFHFLLVEGMVVRENDYEELD